MVTKYQAAPAVTVYLRCGSDRYLPAYTINTVLLSCRSRHPFPRLGFSSSSFLIWASMMFIDQLIKGRSSGRVLVIELEIFLALWLVETLFDMSSESR
ncbi:hypothetical protein BaRGS_00026662 [Batillaria attramentaria]|uniref:Uncharacterized protein n=1 Tax=Batillaria attramentaria TaxID=370345 RepID=A0ABD0K523_9CAEN